MSAAIASLGTELSRGELVNSNAAWLADGLCALGFDVFEHHTVDDDEARIVALLERLAGREQVVVVTGGLGPTTDDLTASSVARWLGVPLVRDAASLEAIAARFARLGRPMSATNQKQADFPEGATVLPNPVGTAPGFAVERAGTRFFFMPGVPSEMKRMFDDQVVPRIRDAAAHTTHLVRFRTFGLPESVVGERLAGIEAASPGVTLGYRAHFPEIEVKVLAQGATRDEAVARAEAAAAEVRERLADVIFGGADDTFAGVVTERLVARGETLAIAESCTGGLVGHLVTKEPGASRVLLLDAVVYANAAKTQVLGVPAALLEAHGAVSEPVARAMAEGARALSGADVAIAITGVAGPDGGTPDKPVGTVFLALADATGTTAKALRFPGSRLQVQTIAAYGALDLVRRSRA